MPSRSRPRSTDDGAATGSRTRTNSRQSSVARHRSSQSQPDSTDLCKVDGAPMVTHNGCRYWEDDGTLVTSHASPPPSDAEASDVYETASEGGRGRRRHRWSSMSRSPSGHSVSSSASGKSHRTSSATPSQSSANESEVTSSDNVTSRSRSHKQSRSSSRSSEELEDIRKEHRKSRLKKDRRHSGHKPDESFGPWETKLNTPGWRSDPFLVSSKRPNVSQDTDSERRRSLKAAARAPTHSPDSNVLRRSSSRPSRTSSRDSGSRSRDSSTKSSSQPIIHSLYERHKPSGSAQTSDLYMPLKIDKIESMNITELDDASKRLFKESYHKDRRALEFKSHAIATLSDWLDKASLLFDSLGKLRAKLKSPWLNDTAEFFYQARRLDVAIQFWEKSDDELVTEYKGKVNKVVGLRPREYIDPAHASEIAQDLADEKAAFDEFLWTWNCVGKYSDAKILLENSKDLFPGGSRTRRGLERRMRRCSVGEAEN